MASGGRRHAEIAGAGLAGLTVATALAHRGWTVRIHERAENLRDLGVGTTIWQNGHVALEAVGALQEVESKGTRIARHEVFDEKRRSLFAEHYDDKDNRALVVLRVDHHRALVNAATSAGVEIVTSSAATAADPDGTLIMENGDRLRADLVIGCDGFNSKIRDSLQLADQVGFVTDAYIGRVTVPRETRPRYESIENHWKGNRRFGVLGCGPVNYLFLSAPENCPFNPEEVRTRSLSKSVWINDYPYFEDLIQRVESDVIWSRYSIVRCRAWSVGRVAILGDSAHAMPPTMAQGAGCAMMNGLVLAETMDGTKDIPAALAEWERRERPVTDVTQRWAVLAIVMAKRWPLNLLDLRSDIIADAFTHPALLAHFLIAARHVPASLAQTTDHNNQLIASPVGRA
jgi:2-polyprenyl-6-methoxyphenol hydroxylase-like FAD-dependent oxidoreductase